MCARKGSIGFIVFCGLLMALCWQTPARAASVPPAIDDIVGTYSVKDAEVWYDLFVGLPVKTKYTLTWHITKISDSPPRVQVKIPEADWNWTFTATYKNGFLVQSFGDVPTRPGSMFGTIDLPKTGQTKCYYSTGAEISCAGTGQDGNIQAGVDWPWPRFSVGADCVTDNLTGLMWSKDANLPGETMNWADALAYVDGRNLCGYTDWRLPNINEIESLSYAEGDGRVWLESQGFTNVLRAYADYWSSTTMASQPDRAWAGDISGNGLPLTLPKENDLYGLVWPVRGSTAPPAQLWKTGQTACYDVEGTPVSCSGTGQDGASQTGAAWPVPRFTNHGDGTATDELTGLMWTTDANAPGPSACYPGDYKTWESGFDYVNCLNSRSYLGHNDWRIPNIKELRSLVDYSQANPVLPSGHPFTNVQLSTTYYRSSTTATYGPSLQDYSWCLNMKNGNVEFGWKGQGFYIWPVRQGLMPASSYSAALGIAIFSGKPGKLKFKGDFGFGQFGAGFTDEYCKWDPHTGKMISIDPGFIPGATLASQGDEQGVSEPGEEEVPLAAAAPLGIDDLPGTYSCTLSGTLYNPTAGTKEKEKLSEVWTITRIDGETLNLNSPHGDLRAHYGSGILTVADANNITLDTDARFAILLAKGKPGKISLKGKLLQSQGLETPDDEFEVAKVTCKQSAP